MKWNHVKWIFLSQFRTSREPGNRCAWHIETRFGASSYDRGVGKREESSLPVAASYGEERGNPPDTYRGDQREARLVRNLYHIFLLYTTFIPSLSSSSQNRFRSVRGRAQWARHGESSTSSERAGKEAARERMTGQKGRQEARERERKRELASFNREGSCHVVRAILPPFVSLSFSCGSTTPSMPQTAPSFTFELLGML